MNVAFWPVEISLESTELYYVDAVSFFGGRLADFRVFTPYTM
jgi:hypothetical protein